MNPKNQWTPTEVTQLKARRAAGASVREIADAMGRTIVSVERKLSRLPKPGSVQDIALDMAAKCPALPPVDYAKALDPAPFPHNAGETVAPIASPEDNPERLAYWKKRAGHLERDLAKAQEMQTATEILVDAAKDLAPKSYDPAPKVEYAPKGKGQAQSAVLMFSDTHIGQVVKPEQTMGLGGYNFELFCRRLARLERSVESILKDHTTTEVPEIVVAMLGDMIHGSLAHSVEAGQVNTLFTQFYNAGHAIAQFFRNISAIAPVRVHTAVGNHPRWGTQKKMPTDNRFSNLDQFLYAYVQALLTDVPRVRIVLDQQPFSRFAVQGWNFLAGHGDHLRGGDKNLGIPNHAIGRNVQVHSQLAFRAGEPLPNYFLVGHLHRPITLPTTMGEFIVNGGFPGLDGFALMEAFNSSHPSQKFFLVHPKFGRSATYDLRLDLGDTQEHHYSFPQEFPCQ